VKEEREIGKHALLGWLFGWLVRLAPMGYTSRGIGGGVGVGDDYYDDLLHMRTKATLNSTCGGWSFDPRRGVDIIRTNNIKKIPSATRPFLFILVHKIFE
jgi:hypothetical protein